MSFFNGSATTASSLQLYFTDIYKVPRVCQVHYSGGINKTLEGVHDYCS